MGISVEELLRLDYFRDFNVIAGRGGLHKEIQGVSVLEAPDATKWSQGKELVLSSGYVISKEPDCIKKSFENGSLGKCSAFVLKRGRYIDKISDEIIELFDMYNVPLISMPFSVPWMELMNKINTTIINRTIKRFRIQNEDISKLYDKSYREEKIQKILKAVEMDMKFPAFLYDVIESRSYYSSDNFKKISRQFNLKDEDYWNPKRDFVKHTLCDYINMARFRLMDIEYENSRRVSWIIMPIIMDGVVQAYFIVMESKEFIDFYDEYSIRIAFLQLQNVYEQIFFVRNMGNIGFENFVNFAITYKGADSSKLFYQANIQGMDVNKKYIHILFSQLNNKISANEYRKEFVKSIDKALNYRIGKLAFIDENQGMIFIEIKEDDENITEEYLKNVINNIRNDIMQNNKYFKIIFSASVDSKYLSDVKKTFDKLKRVMKMGSVIYPKKIIWFYNDLGPLAWLDIPEEELRKMILSLKNLIEDEKNIEILKTLEVYLENNMNYSITADKMYVHINTIRKRIEKIDELLGIDLSNCTERLKIIILLKYLNL